MAYGTWLVGIAGLGWGWTWCSFQPKPFNGSVIQGGLLPAVSCPWLASKPSCGSSALPSEELSFSGSKDTSSFSKGHFSSKAAEQTTRSRRQPAHRKKQSHSLSEGDSTRTGCCEDWTPSPTILAFTVQAVTWWPVSSGICVGPWCKDAGSTLGATGTFIHGKAAARNHLGSKTPMTPERKMLNVLPLLLPKKGGVASVRSWFKAGGSSWYPNKHRNQNPAAPKPLLSLGERWWCRALLWSVPDGTRFICDTDSSMQGDREQDLPPSQHSLLLDQGGHSPTLSLLHSPSFPALHGHPKAPRPEQWQQQEHPTPTASFA